MEVRHPLPFPPRSRVRRERPTNYSHTTTSGEAGSHRTSPAFSLTELFKKLVSRDIGG